MLNKNHDLPQSNVTKQHLPKLKVVVDNGNDKIYPGSDRFIALSKENPKLLGKILQQQINEGMKKLYEKKKAAGLSVHYADRDYPGCWIREDANDRRY